MAVTPNVSDGKNWKLIWNDEFNGNSLNNKKWRIEKIEPDYNNNNAQMSQHVTNTFGFDSDGNKKDGAYPHGKRHAMWYNDHLDKTLAVNGGALRMGGYKSDEDDPTIKEPYHPYTHPRNGKTADFRKKIFCSWVDTYAMTWNGGMTPQTTEHSPNLYFRYGFVEFGVNFENVRTEGFRISGWLLPAVDPADEDTSLVGGTYDSDDGNGVELDVWEYEYTPHSKNLLLCKNIGANAKKLPATDLSKFGIDITKGDHTIAVNWGPHGTYWYVDGIKVNEDTQCKVEIAMYICVTREGNSGVNSGEGIRSNPPYIQNDPGLFAYNIGTEDKSKIDADEAVINYVRVFQDQSVSGNWISKYWRDLNGVEDASAAKPTPATPATTPVVTDMKPLDVEPTESNFSLRVDGKVLRWEQTHSKNQYDVKFNKNVYKATVTGNSFTIPDDYDEGTYYVTQTPDDKNFIDSNKVEFSRNPVPVQPLETPVVEKVKEAVQVIADASASDDSVAAGIVDQISSLASKLSGLLKK